MSRASHSGHTAHAETLALHAASPAPVVGNPIAPPIILSTNFQADPDAIGFSAVDMADSAPPFYARWGNPTVGILEGRLSALEGGAGAV